MLRKGILLFVFVNSVFSEESDVNAKGRYNFNHPPSVEEYNPIPVTVVYEETRLEDAIGTKSNKPSDETRIESTTVEEFDIPVTTKPRLELSSVATAKLGQRSTAKPRAIDAYKIPVQVIYDAELNTSTNQRLVNPALKPLRRRVKQRKLQHPKTTTENTKLTEKFTLKPAVITEVLTLNDQKLTGKNYGVVNSETKKLISSEKLEHRNLETTRAKDPVVPILESENQVFSHNGNFRYSYEGGDGTRAYSEGTLKKIEDDAGEAVVGGFSYTDKDGNDYSLSYTADENGYRPVGAHLPTPPPIPPAIARALAYIATATTPKSVTESIK